MAEEFKKDQRKYCPRCGNEMPTRTSHQRRKTYCSKRCANQGPHNKTKQELSRGKKVCNRCGRDLPFTSYSQSGLRDDGTPILYSRCKECRNIDELEYYQRNRSKKIAEMKDYDKAHAEEIRERRRRYYVSNRRQILAEKKEYHEKNKKQRSEYNRQYRAKHRTYLSRMNRDYRQNNREKMRAMQNRYVRERYSHDPGYRLMRTLSRLMNHWASGRKRGRSYRSLVGYGPDELIAHLNQGEYTVKDYQQGGYHIDHIIPKNLYEADEIDTCWALRNLRIIPGEENIARDYYNVDWSLVHEYDISDLLPRSVLENGLRDAPDGDE